jgi:phosphoribosylanthranilate isomerase
MTVEVKICGLGRPEDARLAEAAGADYLGVVFAPGPRQRNADEARRIWEGAGGRRVGVFVDPGGEEVWRLATSLELAVIQLHGSEAPELCDELREAGDWAVWKAIRLGGETRLEAALDRYGERVDGILLEGWSARGRGGVGARFEWSLAGRLREGWPDGLRLIAAGGLNAGNVAAAIAQIRPHVVDVSSGVEAALGVKDPEAVRAFLDAVRRAGSS